jgi:hypothetical protein
MFQREIHEAGERGVLTREEADNALREMHYTVDTIIHQMPGLHIGYKLFVPPAWTSEAKAGE